MQVHSFIFNWRGQYEKTKEKERQFKDLGLKLTIINSDEVHNDEGWENVGEDAYFTAQFIRALELFEGDVLFHVQADASYDKWANLLHDAQRYYKKYNWGIYAPNVNYTWYDQSRTDISTLRFEGEDVNLRMVACPDCTCWFIHKDIIDDLRINNIDMSPYKMGWGWDIVLPALSFMRARPVIRDYTHTISHPPGTNYNKEQAEVEMQALFNSLSPQLQSLFYAIKGPRNMLAQCFRRT